MKKSQVYLLICLALMLFGGCSSEQTSGYVSKGADYAKQPMTTVVRTTVTTDPLVGDRTSFKDMRVGDIGKTDDLYIALSHIKRTNKLPGHGLDFDASNGKEIIVGFFELYNNGQELKYVDPSKITCYADGVQVGGVEDAYGVRVDGVNRYNGDYVDPGFKVLSCQDFEVPVDWKEIKFFYQSDCVWTANSEEVTDSPFSGETIIPVKSDYTETKKGDVIYSDGYTIEYEGYKFAKDDEDYFVVFKYKVTNNMDKMLDYEWSGSKMRAYQDGAFLGDADFVTVDWEIDGHRNFFDVDSIAPGMSANLYVAFEAGYKPSVFYMIYDDGAAGNHYCGSVYIKHE